MSEDKKKTTALTTSVGADDGQSIPQYTNIISDKDGDYNPVERDYEELLREMNRRAAPDYLHTVTMSELYRNVYTGRAPIIDGLLCSGAYILGDRAVVLQNKGPPASHSGGCRSSRIPPHPLGERNALLMALLSKVLLRYF